MFGGYSDSLVFLLIRSLCTTAEPERNRSLTNFLKSTATGLKDVHRRQKLTADFFQTF